MRRHTSQFWSNNDVDMTVISEDELLKEIEKLQTALQANLKLRKRTESQKKPQITRYHIISEKSYVETPHDFNIDIYTDKIGSMQEQARKLLNSSAEMKKYNGDVACGGLVACFLTNSDFATDLTAAFDVVGYDLKPKPNPSPAPILSSPDKPPRLWIDRPDHDGRLGLVSQWAAGSADFAAGLVRLAATFKQVADLSVSPTLESFTPQQMQTWREISAAMSRAHRAQLTPEQAAKQSQDGTKRSTASRARMSPEKRAQRNAKEAERQRIKRAKEKALQP